MNKKLKKALPIVLFIIGTAIIIIIGYWIYSHPQKEAQKRMEYEDTLIDVFLDEGLNDQEKIPDQAPETNANTGTEPATLEGQQTSYDYSDVDDYTYRGYIDSILVIEKINMKKAVIRGNTLDDNNFNLDRYYFVTADFSTGLDGNYIIYGHCSMTFGHSFNRLDELEVGDTYYLIKGGMRYDYEVEAKDKTLRSESSGFFPEMKNRVTFVSCEKTLQPGYDEKRVIIMRSKQVGKKVYIS